MGNADGVAATAAAFVRRFGADCGLQLERLLSEIGLQLVFRDAVSYEGALLRFKGVPRGTIVLNRLIREDGRRRFTLAHEIGHYLLPSQQEVLRPCSKQSIESWDSLLSVQEIDANRFAAEILMPAVKLIGLLRDSPTFGLVKTVADLCGTTLTAAACRVATLTTFRMAAVFSQEGRVCWYRPSDEFVRWVRKGALSPDSYAYDAFRGIAIPVSLESVPATAWLFEKGLRDDARILEHSLPMPSYNAVLTVLVIPKEIENDEERDNSLDPEEFTINRKWWHGKS